MNKQLAILAMIVALGGCFKDENANRQRSAKAARSHVNVSPPDVTGTWVGVSQSIVSGPTRHHSTPGANKPLLDNVEFTYVIEGQDKNRFWGRLSSPKGTEALAGVVGLDGTRIVARTSEGEIDGNLVGPDTIELIYSAGTPATVVAVNTMKRQK